jgi:hypothetical protein
LIGQPAADGDALPVIETFKGALFDVLGDRGQVVEIVGADAANEYAGSVEWRRGQRLAIDHRGCEANARDLADAIGDILPVGQRRFQRLHQNMPVESENLVEQFLAETVHDGHHDDQRGHTEHDAKKGEAGNDGNEAFLATRPQIASR